MNKIPTYDEFLNENSPSINESNNNFSPNVISAVASVFDKIKAHPELKNVMKDPGDSTVTEIENFIKNPIRFKLDYLNAVAQIMRSRTGYTEGPQSTPTSRLKGAILMLANAIKFSNDTGKFGFESYIIEADKALKTV